MKYRITEIKTRLTPGHEGHTWVLVEFLEDSGALRLREDFCSLRVGMRRINPKDGDGNPKLIDGSFPDMAKLQKALDDAIAAASDPATDPDVAAAVAALTFINDELWFEDVAVDIAAEITADIESWWNTAKDAGWTGDHTPDGSQPLYKNGKRVPQLLGGALPDRDESDPEGVILQPDVQTLLGVEKPIAP